MGVRGVTGIVSTAAAEHLTLGHQLGVHLKPNDSLKIHLAFLYR
jgi:hypothetical protein